MLGVHAQGADVGLPHKEHVLWPLYLLTSPQGPYFSNDFFFQVVQLFLTTVQAGLCMGPGPILEEHIAPPAGLGALCQLPASPSSWKFDALLEVGFEELLLRPLNLKLGRRCKP